jgi:DNA-binding MarR family transcriptional regulator
MSDLDELASSYNRLAVHLTRRLRLTDRESGVPPARLSALSVLVFGGPQTISELAHAEGVSLPTISRIVRGLENEDLAERCPHPTDGRSATIAATAAGIALMETTRLRRVEQLARRLGRLPSEHIARLRDATAALEALEEVADA